MARTKLKIAVALTTVALLAACGRADGPARSAPVKSGNATQAHLTFWAMGTDGDNLSKILDGFKAANPGITVDVTSVPWQDAANKFQTAIAGNVTPDIAQVGTTLMGGITSAFQTVPSDVKTSVYFPGALKSAQVGDQTVGVPWVVDPRAIYYRTDLAKKAGFDAPPKNWDELKALAGGMQSKGGAKWGLRFSTTPDQELQNALYFPWSNGAQIVSADGTKWTFDTPETVAAYTFYDSFFKEGIADPNPPAGAGAAESAFVSGDLGMLVAGSGESAQLNKAGGDGFDQKYAVATFPKNKSATAFVGGSNLVVFKNSKSSAAAWKLIQWLSQPDVQVKWYETAGGLPAVQSAWQVPELASNKNLAVFGEQLKDTNSPPPTATWLQVADLFGQQIDQMVKAGKSPADTLSAIQSQADQIGMGN